MKQITLKGVMTESTPAGDLKITRRVVDRPSLLTRPDGYGRPMEIAALIPKDLWKGAFWTPSGSKDDKDEFFTWVIMIDESIEDLVLSSCKPRLLYEEGDDAKNLTPEVKEMLTASGIVLTSEMPK